MQGDGTLLEASVLLVDDAPEITELLEPVLVRNGHRTLVARSGSEAMTVAKEQQPEVVVLDIGLPDIDGLEVCRQLRAEYDPLVLMLTSRGDDVDRIMGLSAGADDYVVKPFLPSEIALRVAAMLRRVRGGRTDGSLDGSPSDPGALRIGDLELDPAAREVRVRDQSVALTRIEFDLVHVLMRHPRQVLTKDQLHEHVWGPNWFTTSHVLDVHVSNLRRKLGDPPRAARFVQVVRGVGYRIGPCTTEA